MQEAHCIKHKHSKDAGCKKNGDDGVVKLVGPSKAMADAVVQAKKDAALKWCHYANAAGDVSKTWRYLLVPDSAINGSLTLAQAMQSYGQ